MKRLNKTESLIFVLLFVLCFKCNGIFLLLLFSCNEDHVCLFVCCCFFLFVLFSPLLRIINIILYDIVRKSFFFLEGVGEREEGMCVVGERVFCFLSSLFGCVLNYTNKLLVYFWIEIVVHALISDVFPFLTKDNCHFLTKIRQIISNPILSFDSVSQYLDDLPYFVWNNIIKNYSHIFFHILLIYIMKIRLFKHIENFTSKNWKISDKKTQILFILLRKT